MASEYDKRAAVVESFRAGYSAKKVIEWVKYPKSMVYIIKKPEMSVTIKWMMSPLP